MGCCPHDNIHNYGGYGSARFKGEAGSKSA